MNADRSEGGQAFAREGEALRGKPVDCKLRDASHA